jgi:hypothetical protein
MKTLFIGLAMVCAGVQGWGMMPGVGEIGRHFRSIPTLENQEDSGLPQFHVLGVPVELLAPGMPVRPPLLAPGMPARPPRALC